eukprot:3867699-Pleurochrysis_carterae.AAC.1
MSIVTLSMPGEDAGTDAGAGSAMLSPVDSPGLKYPSEKFVMIKSFSAQMTVNSRSSVRRSIAARYGESRMADAEHA